MTTGVWRFGRSELGFFVRSVLGFRGRYRILWATANGGHIWYWNGAGWTELVEPTGNAGWLHVHRGNLIAGGTFTSIGGTSANRVASFDGATWSALGSGLDDRVRALTTYQGKLIAGGDFSDPDPAGSGLVAQWDGSSWKTMNQGLSGGSFVQTLRHWNNQLIACGDFTDAGSRRGPKPPLRIAVWNGTYWTDIGGGFNNSTISTAVYNNQLYANGAFSNAVLGSGNQIARWTGTDASQAQWPSDGMWEDIAYPGGSSTMGRLLVTHDNKLIVSYTITASTAHFYTWDGTTWTKIADSPDTDGAATNWLLYQGRTLCAGTFDTEVDGVSSNNAIFWDGTNFASDSISFPEPGGSMSSVVLWRNPD